MNNLYYNFINHVHYINLTNRKKKFQPKYTQQLLKYRKRHTNHYNNDLLLSEILKTNNSIFYNIDSHHATISNIQVHTKHSITYYTA